MKNYAQAILLFTGYPLEPIVALEIQKSYQPQVLPVFNNPTKKLNTSSVNVTHRSTATITSGRNNQV